MIPSFPNFKRAQAMIATTLRTVSSTQKAVLFFILTYALIWSGSLPLILYTQSNAGSPPAGLTALMVIFGNYSPLISALLLTYLEGGMQGIRTLLAPLRHWRVAPIWYLVVLGYEVIVLLLASGVAWLLTGQFPAMPDDFPLWALPIVFLVVFFQAGIAEEIGWRGYALPRLQQRWNALSSSLILGMVWAFWHLPSFWIPGTFHYGRGLSFLLWYVVGVLAFTILLTWVFNSTQGSLLLVVLFHTAGNTTVGFLPTDILVGGVPLEVIFYGLVAVGVSIAFGAKHLSRRERVKHL
jgi:uncharacterized protein